MYTGMVGGGRREAPHVPPQKTLKNLVIKIQQNTKREYPPRFSHNPKYPPQKSLKITVHL
jgi:hypothetical protein